MTLTKEEQKAVCDQCGCVAFKKSQHASGCPRGSDPTGAKLGRAMRAAERAGTVIDLMSVLEKSLKKTALRRQAHKGGGR